jgi:2-polyprenyl-3-methyl-5-hydroxy-6-metoxy-1,4-benzoquinol methylase
MNSKVDASEIVERIGKELKLIGTPVWTLRKNNEIHLNDQDPLPSLENTKRINGHIASDDQQMIQFLEAGHVLATQIANIYKNYNDIPLKESSILDWGVGCGRISRHFKDASNIQITGIDVDPINIEWLQRSSSSGNYKTVDPYEIYKPQQTFDLIYSYSVTSHLAAKDTLFWLNNLSKVSTGIMCISTHGFRNTFEHAWWPKPELLLNYLKKGIVGDGSQNDDISDVTPKSYYGDYQVTYQHIYEEWAKVVEIIDVIPMGLGHHDLVVCKSLD